MEEFEVVFVECVEVFGFFGVLGLDYYFVGGFGYILG